MLPTPLCLNLYLDQICHFGPLLVTLLNGTVWPAVTGNRLFYAFLSYPADYIQYEWKYWGCATGTFHWNLSIASFKKCNKHIICSSFWPINHMEGSCAYIRTTTISAHLATIQHHTQCELHICRHCMVQDTKCKQDFPVGRVRLHKGQVPSSLDKVIIHVKCLYWPAVLIRIKYGTLFCLPSISKWLTM